MRDALEVQDLCAFGGKGGEQARLAAAGQAADEPVVESLRYRCERRDDVAAIGAIAAVELRRAPADFAQDMDERAAALSAAPAIDDGLPLPWLVECVIFDDVGDAMRDERCPHLARVEGRDLHVHCPDAG